ncbi:MAG: hypothetical protein JWO85_251 [Candidatus Eremiobacteraeota bacterium]|nr:hypothetical protein [Candidatus Eremiobacteraeota bacterium]
METTDVRDAAAQAVQGSKSFLGKQVDERSTTIGRQIETVAHDLRNVGDQLRSTGVAGGAANYVDRGAELVDQFGHYLQDADSERLITDLEGYARRAPWAVAAGALMLGFAASRFLKTSSARRYRGGGSYSSSSYGTAYGAGTSYGTAYGTRAADAYESEATFYAP